MTAGKLTGSASISFEQPVYIESAAAIAGKKEGDGPLGNLFDMVSKDPLFGTQTWEAAESTLQKETAGLAIGKAGLTPRDIRMAFAGDLLAQTIASSFGIAEMDIPFYGLYGACSTMGEALSLGAMAVSAGYGEHILCAASSHFATAEKEFRFSFRLWQPASSVRYLDRDRKRCLCHRLQTAGSPGAFRTLSALLQFRLRRHYRDHHRKGNRLWFP